MGNTTNYGWPYPEQTDIPDVQLHLKNLAVAIDTSLGGIAGIPLGGVADWPWGAGQIPTWSLLPYGQLLTQASYPSLQTIADAASRPYGGSAGTNFNLPDYRGRVGAGKDDMGGTAANRITTAISGSDGKTLGAVFGAEGITLTTAQLPAHTHTFTTGGESVDHTHSVGINSGTVSADHAHNTDYWVSGAGPAGVVPGGNSAAAPAGPYYYASGGMTANHYHGVSGTTAGRSGAHTHSGTSDSTGSASAIKASQPSIIVNKILRVI